MVAAAADVLLRDGVQGFTINKVITASGVSSATVFKYWRSRGALALDGFVHAVGDEIADYDTGDIRADLIALIEWLVNLAAREPEGTVLAQLIGIAQIDADLAAQFDHHYFGPRRRAALALVDGAKARGEIREDADSGLILDVIWGPCYFRMLMPHLDGQLTPEFARRVVDVALADVLIET